MRIVIATPLYPPDTAPAAGYAKDLAKRLSQDHTVTVLAYTYLPEQIDGVQIQKVPKRSPLPVRLAIFTRMLMRAAREHEHVLVINGASTELPLVLVSFLLGTPMTLLLCDAPREASGIRGLLQRISKQRATRVISTFPSPRPEIFPLEPFPTKVMDAYEAAWREHRRNLAL